MADSGGQEKTEQPTGKRLQENREKGQVAKSMEINSLGIFSSGILLIYLVKDYMGHQLSDLSVMIFSSLDTLELNVNLLKIYVAKGSLYFFSLIAPILIGLCVVGVVVSYSQTGFKITPKALSPQWSKFDPIKGIKNKFFSVSSLVELIKSIFKLLIIGGFSYWVLSDAVEQAMGLVDYSVGEIVIFMLETSIDFLWKVATVFAVLAAADFAFQRMKHKKDMMMTKHEVKEENKQTDGDPQIKARIKGKQISMARSRMIKDIPKADVVITNPTHFAVALKYDMGNKSAPVVLAKGMDFMAQKIKEIAREHNVPIHEDVELARALYRMCDIGDEIPEKLFKAVAKVLAYVFNLKNNKGKKKSIV